MDGFKHVTGGVTSPPGFKASGVKAHIKYDRKDLAVIVSEVPAAAAAVFTTNRIKAAPVLVSSRHLADGTARAIVVNSGCANACTGQKGMEDALEMARITAGCLKCKPDDIFIASTGVIGQQLPMERLISGIKDAVKNLSRRGGHDAAEAIMTTDKVPKETAVSFELDGKTVTIGGMAKGSGMIHPNMATMLAFLMSDVNIDSQLLRKALKYAADRSFNCVTVDGDTSTNDSLVILANGLAGNRRIESEDEGFQVFRDALTEVCSTLARMIARDGEGATKLVEIRVRNAPSFADARSVAMAVANSSLVKTAIFGEDANWGRIICAVGYSGVEVDPDKIDIFIGDEKVAENGAATGFSEENAKKVLEKDEITILIDLHLGDAEALAWTCDFSYDYVKINADYRT
ncbi:MAG: ornithine acetyltransferase [Firmicutes bacterium HGW-Firmicutes-14]|nr:MAG: ornithine acetyltransferase [Firmicutes bacterium HGW-Firmicutes-14]